MGSREKVKLLIASELRTERRLFREISGSQGTAIVLVGHGLAVGAGAADGDEIAAEFHYFHAAFV